MIPYELKRDKDGILYYEENDILRRRPLSIDKRESRYEKYYQNAFYPFRSTDDYIIKFSLTGFARKERREIKEMLANLIDKQKDIKSVDFPIGYFVHMKKLAGLIVKYYKDGVSCDNVFSTGLMDDLGKYYYHDEDSLHNLFLLFEEVLNIQEEMFDNGVYYMDTNAGNIVLSNNQVKIIDFDRRYVKFTDKDQSLKSIMYSYFFLIRSAMLYYECNESINNYCSSFKEAKVYTKKIENDLRKKAIF